MTLGELEVRIELPSEKDGSGNSLRIQAAVLLAGVTGRLEAVRGALARNLFDLPGPGGRPLFSQWLERFRSLNTAERSSPEVWVALDPGAPDLSARGGPLPDGVRVQRDAESSRGPAGVLRDLSRNLADDDHVLVLQASDLAWQWTEAEGRAIFSHPADIVLSADRDLRLAGCMRIRCGLLKRVPSVGFVDLKEQFLARCADVADVGIIQSDRERCGSLHRLGAYLSAVFPAEANVASDGSSIAAAKRWEPDRAIVEAGAQVDAKALLFDSVVLEGARVARDAVVVRSLIGPGAIVHRGEQIVDRVIVGGRRGHTQDIDW